MATKPPTAEEVLGLYGEFAKAAEAWGKATFNDIDARDHWIATSKRWGQAFDHWQAAQGPVTREWFVERFGGYDIKTRSGLGIKHSGSSVPWVYFTDIEGDTRFNQPIVNPTRSDIETLVRVLGGESC